MVGKGNGMEAPLKECGRICQAIGRWLSFTSSHKLLLTRMAPCSYSSHGDGHTPGNGINLLAKLRAGRFHQ